MPGQNALMQSLALLDSPEKLQRIGSTIVRETIAKTLVQKVEARNPRRALRIRKGEMVPESFRATFGIEVDSRGAAKADWPHSLESHADALLVGLREVAEGEYSKTWPDVFDHECRIEVIHDIRPVTREELARHFSDEEIQALRAHGIVA